MSYASDRVNEVFRGLAVNAGIADPAAMSPMPTWALMYANARGDGSEYDLYFFSRMPVPALELASFGHLAALCTVERMGEDGSIVEEIHSGKPTADYVWSDPADDTLPLGFEAMRDVVFTVDDRQLEEVAALMNEKLIFENNTGKDAVVDYFKTAPFARAVPGATVGR